MKKLVSAAIAGLLFGTGIALSGMTNPQKIINFFDIFGTFDPSLIFVMGGGLTVAFIGYRLIFARQSKPVFEESFALPKSKTIDARLVGGAALFGIGWGISGFCPGGAIPALGLGVGSVWIFIVAMSLGILLARLLTRLMQSQNRASDQPSIA